MFFEQKIFKQKNIKQILAWLFFDWANSSFPVIVTTFIFATYFTQQVAADEIRGTFLWANANAIAGIIIAIVSPIFGSIADYGGYHKYWLLFFTILCISSSALLWFAYPEVSAIPITLIAVILGTIGLEVGGVFYNSLLPYVAPHGYLGRISGWAWGFGYIGGILALSIVLFGLIKTTPTWLNTETAAQVRICGPFVAIWFLIFSLPMFLYFPKIPSHNLPAKSAIKKGFRELGATLKSLPKQKNLTLYLIAHLVYIDGINTLFAFGGIYAAGTFNMDLYQVLIFGIVMNITAGFGAMIIAWMDDLVGSKYTILISLAAVCTLGACLLLVEKKIYFWVFVIPLAIFIGPIQSASRSLMARITPKAKSTEMFGLYALSGKITAFIGPAVFGLATAIFKSQRAGMATVLLFLLCGGLLLLKVNEKEKAV